VFVLAALPRAAYLAWAPPFIGGDSLQYYQPVYDLVNGRGFTLSLKRPPAYPVLILAIQSVFGTSFVPIIAFQHILGAATAALTYGIGRLTFGRWAGVLAAVLVAICGPLMRWEHFLMSEALFTFAFTLSAFFIVLGLRRPGLWPWVAAGLALALAILTRSAGQVLLLAVPPALLLVERAWRPALVKTAVMLGACAIVIVPWMARNQAVHNSFTTAGATGQNLITYTAIHHRADFSFEDPLVTAIDADPRKAEARKIVQKAMEDKLAKPQLDVTGLGIHNRIMEETKLSQAQADAVMRDIALRAIASRPLVYVRNTLEDFAEVWVGKEGDLRDDWDLWSSRGWRGPMRTFIGPATPEQEAAYEKLVVLDGLYHPARLALPLTLLFLLGVVLALRHPPYRPALVLAFAAVSLIFISAGTVGVVWRYRLPPDPLINVVAMGALVWLLGMAAARLHRSPRP
jgi:4-amino-4-deoxy-L-arabinose transferase-like glycosyltransferase